MSQKQTCHKCRREVEEIYENVSFTVVLPSMLKDGNRTILDLHKYKSVEDFVEQALKVKSVETLGCIECADQ